MIEAPDEPTADSHGPRSRESGVALILAMVLMTATVLFGIVSLESTRAWVQTEELKTDRSSARTLAEGGLDFLYFRVKANPSYSGSVTRTIGDWNLTMSATQGAGYVDIESVASGEGVSLGYRARALKSGGFLPAGVAVRVGDGVELGPSSAMKWSGRMQYVNGMTVDDTAAYSGRHATDADFTDWTVDLGAYGSIANHSHRAGQTVTRIDKGTHYGQGDLTFSSNALRFSGAVGTEGNMTFEGNGRAITLIADPDSTVVWSKGDLIFKNISTLEITGLMVVGGDLVFENVAAATVFGVAGVSGNLRVTNSVVAWEQDPALESYQPPYVAGGDGQTTIEEAWRKPFTPSR